MEVWSERWGRQIMLIGSKNKYRTREKGHIHRDLLSHWSQRSPSRKHQFGRASRVPINLSIPPQRETSNLSKLGCHAIRTTPFQGTLSISRFSDVRMDNQMKKYIHKSQTV
jgi:hypothetical protein